jgi:hypothetical protein
LRRSATIFYAITASSTATLCPVLAHAVIGLGLVASFSLGSQLFLLFFMQSTHSIDELDDKALINLIGIAIIAGDEGVLILSQESLESQMELLNLTWVHIVQLSYLPTELEIALLFGFVLEFQSKARWSRHELQLLAFVHFQ